MPRGRQYVPDAKVTATPGTLEIQWNANDIPYTINEKGQPERLPDKLGSELREERLADKKTIATQEKTLKSLNEQKSKGVKSVGTAFGMGGRPIQEAIDDAQARINEILSKNPTLSSGTTNAPTSLPDVTPQVPQVSTNVPAQSSKKLSKEQAQEFFNKAGGDKINPSDLNEVERIRAKARQMAKDAGFVF